MDKESRKKIDRAKLLGCIAIMLIFGATAVEIFFALDKVFAFVILGAGLLFCAMVIDQRPLY